MTIENATVECGCGRHNYSITFISIDGDRDGIDNMMWETHRCARAVVTARTPHSSMKSGLTPSACCPNCGGPSAVSASLCDGCAQ